MNGCLRLRPVGPRTERGYKTHPEDTDFTDSCADTKQGSCQKFTWKHGRIRGNRVDSMVTLGLRPASGFPAARARTRAVSHQDGETRE